ncbi:MAG: GNAT family protein [Pseudomonadota bacterium]
MAKIEVDFRPLNQDDIPQITKWISDFEDVALFDRNLPVPVSDKFVEESWKKVFEYHEPPSSLWYMTQTSKGDPIGMCGLQSINYIHGDAVVPMFVTKPYRAMGLASVMMLLLIDLGFNALRLHRISTVYRSDNRRSASLTEKYGFVEEGRVREGWFGNGRRLDVVEVGLLKSEWAKTRPGIVEGLNKSQFKLRQETMLLD